jgi:hypothetical protein
MNTFPSTPKKKKEPSLLQMIREQEQYASAIQNLQINNNQSSAMVKAENTWQPLTENEVITNVK